MLYTKNSEVVFTNTTEFFSDKKMEVKKSSDFISKLSSLKLEGLKWKSEKKLEGIWSEEDDELLDQIDEWIELARDTSETIAESEFKKSSLANKATFLDYLIARCNPEQRINIQRLTNKTTTKVKANRTTSKIDKCKICEWPMEIKGNKMVCTNPDCHEVEDINGKVLKQRANGMKHTRNKIETLIGKRLPPNKMEILYPLVKIWLTDLKYIYDWLDYQETFVMLKNKKTKEQWMRQFMMVYEPKSNVSMGDLIIPEVKEAAWNFNEYKLLILEFHAMLKECDRLASNAEFTYTNMAVLDDDKVVEIMQAYYDVNSKVPDLKETFKYEDEKYDVGNFINLLKLSNDVESNLHKRLNEVFGIKLRIPGLMCNFLIQPVKLVERFTLTEGYSYVIHKVFKIPYIQMPETDIEKILEIIQAFDLYVQKQEQSGTKKFNSKLYVCKLRCIFQMPYFYKYAELINYLPVKSPETTAKILSKWNMFETTEGKNLVEQYYQINDDNEKKDNTVYLFGDIL